MIRSVLSERLGRRNEAIQNITSTWGAQQVISGPILIVPYRYPVKVMRDRVVNGRNETTEVEETGVGRAYFLPADLKITGKLDPSVLHRGIYETVVYRGSLMITGSFTKPSFEEFKVKPENVLWEDAIIALSITDLRGANGSMTMKWGQTSIALRPGSKLPDMPSGVYARLGPDALAGDMTFELPLMLNGSRGISFAPLGAQNDIRLTSSWHDPSFQGAFLPVERKIGPDGFEANWQVSYYGRSYPQQWSTQEGPSPLNAITLQESLFGVDLLSVVDVYRFVERLIKYGILFIVLIFTAFFLFEAITSVRIHPLQYTMVGVALCLFYLALLSLSEILAFGHAYLAGAAASTLMITLYSASILRNLRRALVIFVELCTIYGFLYVIIRQQDYSLLLGTTGLFVALAIVMYATRNIDWYGRDEKEP